MEEVVDVMSLLKVCWHRLTKCDSGQMLNPLMFVFLYVTLAFSVAFVFFGETKTVQLSPLYMESKAAGEEWVSLWGAIGLMVVALHCAGLLIRNLPGIYMMIAAAVGGFYLWLWATVLYAQEDLWFQFAAAAIPNLLFWCWYTWQWYRRFTHQGNKTFSAFV